MTKTNTPDEADMNSVDGEVMLICYVIFRDGRPVLIKAMTDYPLPNNPLSKAFDIKDLIAKEANKARLDTINKIFEFSPTTQFKDWKAEDAMVFYQRLKAYESRLTADKETNNEQI